MINNRNFYFLRSRDKSKLLLTLAVFESTLNSDVMSTLNSDVIVGRVDSNLYKITEPSIRCCKKRKEN